MAERVEILKVEVDNEQAGKELAEIVKELARIQKEQAALNKELKAGNTLTEEQAKAYADNIKEIDRLKAAQKTAVKEIITGIKNQKGSLNDLRESIKQLVDQRNKISLDTKEGQDAVKDLNKQIKELNDQISEIEQEGGNFRGNVGNYTSALDGIGIAASGAVNGFKNFVAAAAALIASPIGLILAAIAAAIFAVRQAFKDSEEGQNKYAKLMGVIGSVVGNLTDLISRFGMLIIEIFENPTKSAKAFGNAIRDNISNRLNGILELIPNLAKAIKQFFEGDFSGAAETAANAVAKVVLGVNDFTGKAKAGFESATRAAKEFAGELEADARKAARIADLRATADKEARKLLIDRAKQEARINELRLKARQQEKFSAEERKQFLLEAQELQDEIFKREENILKLRKEAIVAEGTLSNSNKEFLDQEAEAIAAVERVSAQRFAAQREFAEQLNTLNNQIAAEEKARQDKEAAEAKARAEEEERRIQNKISAEQRLREERIKTAEMAAETEEERKQAEVDRAEFEAELRKQKIEKEVEDAQLRADLLAEIEKQLQLKIADINRKATEEYEKEKEKQKRIDEANAKAEIDLAQAVLDITGGFLQQGTSLYKGVKIAETIISTAAGIQKTLAEPTLPFPANTIQAGIIAAKGAANIATIAAAAGGGEFVTRGPQLLLVGDNPGGQEKVSISPIGGRGQTRTAGTNLDIIQQNQAADVIRDQAQAISSALAAMPPPVLVVKDYQRAAKRVQVKESISSF